MLASEFLTQVRNLGMLPSASTQALDDVSILRHADMEVQTRLLPMLRRLNEEYLVASVDITAVNGRVELPLRAAGAAVRHVQLVTTGGGLRPLPRLMPEQTYGYPTATTHAQGYYFDGGGLVLQPDGASGTVRLRYYMRPGAIRTLVTLPTSYVGADPGGLIASVTADTPTIGRTTFVISQFTSGVPAGSVDFVSQGPAHDATNVSVAITGVSATQFHVATSDLTRAVRVGDYAYPAGYTPVVPVPEELSGVLVGLTVARALMACGYQSEAAQQLGDAEKSMLDVEQLLRPRSEGNPKVLTGGILAGLGAFGNWRGW